MQCNTTRRQRQEARWLERAKHKLQRFKANLREHREHPDAAAIKRTRRMKAVAKKLSWLSRQDVEAMTPEARRAALRLLQSDLAREILRG